MERANITVRKAARAAGVPMWRVAMEMGISEPTMTRRLRIQFTSEQEAEILSIIERLSNRPKA